MSDIWDNKKAKDQKRMADRMRGGAGKGDSARNNSTEAYRLGFKLTQLDKDTPEYNTTLKAWRKAVKEGR